MIGQCPSKHETCPYYNAKPKKTLRKQFGEKTGCYADVHHYQFPKRDYVTPIERAFREMPENKEQMCRWDHDLEHFEASPRKPSLEQMIVALTAMIDNPVPLETM